MPGKIFNASLFNLSWLAIVYSQSLTIALPVTIAHLALHQVIMCNGPREWLLILIVTLLGLALDQFAFALGVFNIEGKAALAPLWLSCLWPVLATTLGHAFALLQSRPLLAAAAGAIGGTASYLAGTGISNVDFGSSVGGPIIIAAVWSLLLPLLLRLAVTCLRPKSAG